MTHFSTGIDLVEINRVQRLLDGHKKYWDEIFTSREVDYCLKKKKNPFQHFAVRFAAKEAMLKALGIGLLSGFKLKDIEVVNDISGRPKINLYGKVKKLAEENGVRDISISLSHSSQYAIAQVLLISGE
jgi:holo-[acyl-carrier protein] synthase